MLTVGDSMFVCKFFTVGPYKRSVAGIAELPDTLRLIRPTNPVQQQPLAPMGACPAGEALNDAAQLSLADTSATLPAFPKRIYKASL